MFQRFLRYYKPHRALFILDMTVAVAGAFLAIAIPYIIRRVLNLYIPNRQTDLIFLALSTVTIMYLLKALMSYIQIKWGHILGVRIEYDMRCDIFRHLQKLSFTYFDNTKTGHIMSRISHDLSFVAEIAHHAPEDVLISFLVIVGSFVMMLTIEHRLAFVALIPLPLMMAWAWWYGNSMRRCFKKARERIAEINSAVENSVQGIREVKSFANESKEINKFDCVNKTYRFVREDAYAKLGTFYSVMSYLRDFYYLIPKSDDCLTKSVFILSIFHLRWF